MQGSTKYLANVSAYLGNILKRYFHMLITELNFSILFTIYVIYFLILNYCKSILNSLYPYLNLFTFNSAFSIYNAFHNLFFFIFLYEILFECIFSSPEISPFQNIFLDYKIFSKACGFNAFTQILEIVCFFSWSVVLGFTIGYKPLPVGIATFCIPMLQ